MFPSASLVPLIRTEDKKAGETLIKVLKIYDDSKVKSRYYTTILCSIKTQVFGTIKIDMDRKDLHSFIAFK